MADFLPVLPHDRKPADYKYGVETDFPALKNDLLLRAARGTHLPAHSEQRHALYRS